MQLDFFNANAPEKPTNLSINADLLQQAKERHINLSQALELRLVELLCDEKRRDWQEENREALDEYHRRPYFFDCRIVISPGAVGSPHCLQRFFGFCYRRRTGVHRNKQEVR